MTMKAVCFDLFETLITEFEGGRRVAVRNDRPLVEMLGLSYADFKAEWHSRQKRRMNGELADYYAVWQDILDQRNLPMRKDVIDQLYQARVKEKESPFARIRSDIMELLTLLRNRSVKVGLVSNCTEEEVTFWQQSKLAPFFHDVIFSYKAGMAKPDERIYRLACDHLSVEPEETLFVGDGGSNELEGADNAGMTPLHAYWYNTYVESPFKKIARPLDIINEVQNS